LISFSCIAILYALLLIILTSLIYLFVTACLAALTVLIPKLSEAIQTDPEIDVVNEALDCFTELLKELKGLAIKSDGHLDAVLVCIKMVFNKGVRNLRVYS
jgi:hypothetical protein